MMYGKDSMVYGVNKTITKNNYGIVTINTCHTAPEKRGIQINIFLISP